MANPMFEREKSPVAPSQGSGVLETIYNRMYQTIPEFRDLANSAKGKPIEQVYAENGQDYNKHKNMKPGDILQMLMNNGMM